MPKRERDLPSPRPTSNSEVDAFLRQVATTRAPSAGRGRLLFAMDATASREPTWDRACQIQGEMFDATASLGGLSVQLAYYRGFGEFRATPWVSSSGALVRHMSGVSCRGGHTQIGRVLGHAVAETKKQRVNALVFVGDCMEEDVDRLCALAGELGMLGVPAFLFHEGAEPTAALAFRQIARLTNGAYLSFDTASAEQLKELLRAVAVYAVGGRPALEDYGRRAGGTVLQIAHQIK